MGSLMAIKYNRLDRKLKYMDRCGYNYCPSMSDSVWQTWSYCRRLNKHGRIFIVCILTKFVFIIWIPRILSFFRFVTCLHIFCHFSCPIPQKCQQDFSFRIITYDTSGTCHRHPCSDRTSNFGNLTPSYA